MASIAPFRALRYSASRVGDLGRVWAPPYDVISARQKKSLRARHPNNIVRITLPIGRGPDRYDKAAEVLESWIADRLVIQQSRPAVYVHRHRFLFDGEEYFRTGFWTLVRLVPLDAGVVLPHERTMSGPKADRLALMRACRAQLSPIFFISSDDSGWIESTLRSWTAAEPVERVEYPRGHRHELWRVPSGEVTDRLAGFLEKETLLIADGHHRYETALAVRDQLNAGGASPSGDGAHEFVLSYVVSERDPGLLLLPTHRVLSGLGEVDWTNVLVRMEAYFTVRTIDEADAVNPEKVIEGAGGSASIVLVLKNDDRVWLLSLRPSSQIGDRWPESARQLGAVAFHEIFVREGLGLGLEQEEEHLSYVRDPSEALQKVREGPAEAAALVATSPVVQIREAAEAGERLPTKTTFFWPKVPTGVAFHRIDPEEKITVPGEVKKLGDRWLR